MFVLLRFNLPSENRYVVFVAEIFIILYSISKTLSIEAMHCLLSQNCNDEYRDSLNSKHAIHVLHSPCMFLFFYVKTQVITELNREKDE